MSKISIAGATTGTGTFTLASPATNVDRVLTLPDEAGTVLTSASSVTQNSGPAFSAYSSGGQSLTGGTITKIQFNAEDFDTDSCYDVSTYRFTPTRAGYYQVNGVVAVATATGLQTAIYKNGTVWMWGQYVSSSNWANCSGLVYMNGTTDYIELYCYIVATLVTQSPSAYKFQASMVRAA